MARYTVCSVAIGYMGLGRRRWIAWESYGHLPTLAEIRAAAKKEFRGIPEDELVIGKNDSGGMILMKRGI